MMGDEFLYDENFGYNYQKTEYENYYYQNDYVYDDTYEEELRNILINESDIDLKEFEEDFEEL